MKNKFSILVLVLFGFQILTAQQEFYYGPKVGISASHLLFSGDGTEVLKENSGLAMNTHIGGFVEIVLSEFFSIQPELMYSVKGARFRDNAAEDYKSAFVYKYLTLPVIAKYYATEKISIEGGPYVSYLLSAKNVEVNGIFSSNYGSEAAAIDLKDDRNPLDVGVALGVGYITKTGFYLSTRYEYGLMNSYKSTEFPDVKMNNGNIMLSAGFSLNY
jgi:hypothetical protein